MNKRRFHIFIIAILLMLVMPHNANSKESSNFGVNYQFNVDLPKAGLSGILKGYLVHIQNNNFRFEGNFNPERSPLRSGPIRIRTELSLEKDSVAFRKLSIRIASLHLNIPELELHNPNISITGNGVFFTENKTANFTDLKIKVGNLPIISAGLNYSPKSDGTLSLNIFDPLPLLQEIAEKILGEAASKWEKEGKLDLSLSVAKINSAPEPKLLVNFENLSASSPDGLYLVDSLSGSLKSSLPLDDSKISAVFNINTGEALFNTLYLDLNKNPLKAAILATLPNRDGAISSKIDVNWQDMGSVKIATRINTAKKRLRYSGTADINIPYLGRPFKTLIADPFSLADLSANGTINLTCKFNGSPSEAIIKGIVGLTKGSFHSSDIESRNVSTELPFAIVLGNDFLPQTSDKIKKTTQGTIRLGEVRAGPLVLKNFNIPLSVSSNEVIFGEIPLIALSGGQLKLVDVQAENPFSKDFVLSGKLNLRDVNLLPLSPPSLPVDGILNGDLQFWLLAKTFSTEGSFYGKVYGGDMEVSEIFAENPFSKSRQYGADFKVNNLKLIPLSKALDIGRITGRMNLDLTDLVVAYDQPAEFKLIAVSIPDADSDQEISLKAVNTLSVIGTGSGLTGAGVGLFSQFFRQFSYAGLGLECTLNNDLFKIRGLIREDGIEYIIKKPPLFGINVINSNPENLISFSDMLKRLKRISE